MSTSTVRYGELTQFVSTQLATLRATIPEVLKSFNDLGRAAVSSGVLDKKTKELIALALSVAARCDPCIGFHMKSLVALGVTRQEIDETLGSRSFSEDCWWASGLAWAMAARPAMASVAWRDCPSDRSLQRPLSWGLASSPYSFCVT